MRKSKSDEPLERVSFMKQAGKVDNGFVTLNTGPLFWIKKKSYMCRESSSQYEYNFWAVGYHINQLKKVKGNLWAFS